MSIWADSQQSEDTSAMSMSALHCGHPMLPLYVRSRNQRARAPRPIEHQGQFYDIMGVDTTGKLLLRDQRAVHQDVRLEDFAGRTATLDGVCWQVLSLEAVPGPALLELVPVLHLVDPDLPSRVLTVPQASMERVRFLSRDSEHKPGRIKHGIMRLVPTLVGTKRRMRLRPGQQFESRLRHRELQGPFMVKVGIEGHLMATKIENHSHTQQIPINLTDIVPRYRRVASLDFGAHFDVDRFAFNEDRLRNQAANVGNDPHGGPIQDPLFGTLPQGGTAPELTNGAEHLVVFQRFIQDHTPLPKTDTEAARSPRRLTILNLSMSNQGDARCVLDALVVFRRQNPTAQICVVASKLGPTEFQESPEFSKYIELLARNRIEVNDYTNTDGRTRQVMHGKAIAIDDHVLFSTGAVMDTRPINKADFSLELPRSAAIAFCKYIDETIYGDATPERRAELAIELGALGVVINDPVASLTYISRAQDALIRGARHELIISLSELVDPCITKLLIQRASSGINVIVQVRELDSVSNRLLASFMKSCPNLRLEDSSWWEPRPHWNAIIADGTVAYVGSSYLWSTQRNMLHQGRSFENGVLLNVAATDRVCGLIADLRHRNVANTWFGISKIWNMQHKLYLKTGFLYFENSLRDIAFSASLAKGTCSYKKTENDIEASSVNCTDRWLLQQAVMSLPTRMNAFTKSSKVLPQLSSVDMRTTT